MWEYLPEMINERSNSTSCIIYLKENEYILNIFGYNNPSKQYLSTIEYLDLKAKDSFWKFLNFKNINFISLNIANLFCMN